jgi:DNA polymerase-4
VSAAAPRRQIVHVDMDAFYASVEQLDDPSLRGKPLIVGGASRRGVVCAASYEVRPFGVRSAMPMAEALRRAPHAVVRAPRMARYAEVSARVFEIFLRFTPLVEGLSLDEAFLDVTGSRALFGDGEAVARAVKAAIRNEVGLRCSAGVATSKFAAKIASDLRKPDALVVVPDDVAAFLAPLPIERMWGIGPRSAVRMRAAGFGTIGDLAAADPARLEALLGTWGRAVHAFARGLDDRPVEPDGEAKSVGAEETFERDLHTRDEILREALAASERVAQRLVREGLYAATVHLKLKYADFSLRTRQVRLPEPVCDTASIHRAASGLLPRMPSIARGVRLVGVSVSELCALPPAPSLFPDARAARGRALESVTASLRERFGDGALRRASLLDGRAPTVRRPR